MIPQIKKILYATDLSKNSAYAFYYAVDMAKKHDAKIVVQVGYPVEEILKVADEEGCDLIVLGNHGKGFLQQTFLGSISRSVLDRTRKPVFIIPLPSEKTSVWDEL
jgi:nucleotide-binding universal stress UspA family protein